MKKVFLIGAVLCATLTSCYTSRTYVGDIAPGTPTVEVNDVKVHHLICGLVGVGNNKINDNDYVGERTNYVVKHQQSFVDGLLSAITFGIYTPTTVTFEVPVNELGK